MKIRLMPPLTGPNSHTVNGRTYTAPRGTVLDVRDFDGFMLEGNGWLRLDQQGADVTANRPTSPRRGQTYHDTTLGFLIVWDGATWRNPANGATV